MTQFAQSMYRYSKYVWVGENNIYAMPFEKFPEANFGDQGGGCPCPQAHNWMQLYTSVAKIL